MTELVEGDRVGEERALLVGGTLEIYTQPGEGTTVELTMEGP